jgi:hypothetical protein
MMEANKTKLSAVFFALVVPVLACVASGPDRAKDYLLRSIKGTFSFNITAVLKQRDTQSDQFLTYKVQRTRRGMIRNTVLAPLRAQGNETVDDGEKRFTIVPSEKAMLVEPSSNRNEDINFRIPLILKN